MKAKYMPETNYSIVKVLNERKAPAIRDYRVVATKPTPAATGFTPLPPRPPEMSYKSFKEEIESLNKEYGQFKMKYGLAKAPQTVELTPLPVGPAGSVYRSLKENIEDLKGEYAQFKKTYAVTPPSTPKLTSLPSRPPKLKYVAPENESMDTFLSALKAGKGLQYKPSEEAYRKVRELFPGSQPKATQTAVELTPLSHYQPEPPKKDMNEVYKPAAPAISSLDDIRKNIYDLRQDLKKVLNGDYKPVSKTSATLEDLNAKLKLLEGKIGKDYESVQGEYRPSAAIPGLRPPKAPVTAAPVQQPAPSVAHYVPMPRLPAAFSGPDTQKPSYNEYKDELKRVFALRGISQ